MESYGTLTKKVAGKSVEVLGRVSAASFDDSWNLWKVCESPNLGNIMFKEGSARAVFLYKDGTMVIGFAGTDGAWDIFDLYADMDVVRKNYTTGITGQRGIFNYMEMTSECLNEGVDLLEDM